MKHRDELSSFTNDHKNELGKHRDLHETKMRETHEFLTGSLEQRINILATDADKRHKEMSNLMEEVGSRLRTELDSLSREQDAKREQLFALLTSVESSGKKLKDDQYRLANDFEVKLREARQLVASSFDSLDAKLLKELARLANESEASLKDRSSRLSESLAVQLEELAKEQDSRREAAMRSLLNAFEINLKIQDERMKTSAENAVILKEWTTTHDVRVKEDVNAITFNQDAKQSRMRSELLEAVDSKLRQDVKKVSTELAGEVTRRNLRENEVLSRLDRVERAALEGRR